MSLQTKTARLTSLVSHHPKHITPNTYTSFIHTSACAFSKTSSTRWLQRQRHDPYIRLRDQGPAGSSEGRYVSRSAFKLLELQKLCHNHLLRSGFKVADLGCAPGGWTQVCKTLVGKGGSVVGVDLLDMDPRLSTSPLDLEKIEAEIKSTINSSIKSQKKAEKEKKDLNGNFTFIKGDLTSPSTLRHLQSLGPFDVVLSDMLGNTTGNSIVDGSNSFHLCSSALHLAIHALKPQSPPKQAQSNNMDGLTDEETEKMDVRHLAAKGGSVVMKAYDCPEIRGFVKGEMKKHFQIIKVWRLKSSRDESKEMYICGFGIKPFPSP